MRVINRGFTLFELMITVAVIGLLAALAVPAYQDFSIRSRVSEALNMGSAAKNAVIDAASSHGLAGVKAVAMGNTPSSNPSPFVKEIAIEDGGRIVMKTRNTGADPDPELWLVPSENGGAIIWECRVVQSASMRHVPVSCRNLASSSASPAWSSASNSNSISEKNTVQVIPKSDGGFTTKPVLTDPNDPNYFDPKPVTRGQPALVDMPPTSSGQFDLQNVAVSNSTWGGWGVAMASQQNPFSGYTVQFETMNSACGGQGPCMVLVEWKNGQEGVKSPPVSLPPDYSVASPGNVSVKVDGSGLNVSVGGKALFQSDSLKGDEWVFGVRSWNGATLNVGGSKLTTP